jgi:hypothetical protein
MIVRFKPSAILTAHVALVAVVACSGPGSPDLSNERTARTADALQKSVGIFNFEPTIAVNPINPFNIAVSGGLTFSLSTDWGATFNNYGFAQPSNNENNDGDIVLAYDSTGRLFGQHISLPTGSALGDIVLNEVNPSTGAAINTYIPTASLGASGHDYDNAWLAADHYPNSPFHDRLYLAWAESAVEHAAWSADHGQSWQFVKVGDMPTNGTTPGQTSLPTEVPAYSPHIAVAPNGDVYIAFHAQHGGYGVDRQPDGTSGSVTLLRSTDGGVHFNQRTVPYGKGASDIPNNDPPDTTRPIPHNSNYTTGSAQPYIVPDPLVPGDVSVIAADDTNNGGTANIHVFIARSVDYGATFTKPVPVDSSGTATSFFPAAAADDRTGCLAVMWYDNRAASPSQINANDYKLDLYARGSMDHGVTFGPEVKIDKTALDPDLNAVQRNPGEYRIGEYNGLAAVNGVAYAAWTATDPSSGAQAINYDFASVCNVPSEPSATGNVAAAQQDPNTTSVLVAGNDGAIWERWVVQNGGWQGPVARTGKTLVAAGTPIIMAPNGSSEFDAFFVDLQGQLREMTETNNNWTLVSAPLTAAGSLSTTAHLAFGTVNGNIRLVAYVDKLGTLGGVFSVSGGTWQTGTLTGQNFAPAGAPVAIGNQDSNQLDVFTFDTHGTLQVVWYKGAWFGPAPLSAAGEAFNANLATAMQGASQLDVFFVGSNGALRGAWVTKVGATWGAWNAPVNLTATSYAPAGAPVSPALWPSNQLDVFYVNNDGALAASWVAIPGPQPWQGPGTASPKDYALPQASVATALQYGGQLDIFTAGRPGVLATWTTAAGWSPTVPLP